MDFHTWVFGLFFLAFYAVYVPLQRTRLRLPWLLLASYVFYAWANPRCSVLLLYVTLIDYLVVRGMAWSRWKRPWLLVSILNDLGVLAYARYSVFLIDNLNWLLAHVGLPLVPAPTGDMLGQGIGFALSLPGIHLSLPAAVSLGVSFFTFRSLTYTIDFYRGRIEMERNPIRYAAFVAFFPELIAGPIDRAGALLPQFRQAPGIRGEDIADGLSLFVVGLFKKLALADYMAVYVAKIYVAPGQFHSADLLLGTLVFAWQIYFDFSGYSDMARGVGRLLGYKLALNFNNPYLATGLGDFWNRWHISLSSWFKDYVYIPLGGNRRGEFRTYVNMCLTMVISGLWHNPAWTYVIWGAVHALGRVLTRFLELSPFYQNRVPRVAKQLLTFVLVSVAWIFFRAATFGDAMAVLRGIFALQWAVPCCPVLMLAMIFAVWVYQFVHESRLSVCLRWAPVRIGLVVLMVAYLALFSGSSSPAFIYAQF